MLQAPISRFVVALSRRFGAISAPLWTCSFAPCSSAYARECSANASSFLLFFLNSLTLNYLYLIIKYNQIVLKLKDQKIQWTINR